MHPKHKTEDNSDLNMRKMTMDGISRTRLLPLKASFKVKIVFCPCVYNIKEISRDG